MATLASSPAVEPIQPRIRLPYLDGIRGLAALLVAISHFGKLAGGSIAVSSLVFIAHTCVVVFITLSGYVLMLPISLASTYEMTDIWGFVKRRAKRILPPYYGALLISCLVIWCFPSLKSLASRTQSIITSTGMLYCKDIILHVLLIHNISPLLIKSLNGPLWSIATEWQIYFVFALFLLPVLRRFGKVAVLAAGFAFVAFAQIGRFEQACPWLVGSFAVGMVAADLSTRENIRKNFNFLGLAIAAIAVLVMRHLHLGAYEKIHAPLLDETCALATGVLLLYMRFAPESFINRFFESKPLKVLGEFSYSLYVIHWPILLVIVVIVPGYGLTYFFKLCLFLPVVIGLAYGFHLIFERPFMRWKIRHS